MNTFSIVILAIGVLSVLTNAILLVILYLDPLKKFRTTTSYLIISLTISDFLTGTVACVAAFDSHVAIVILHATILSSTKIGGGGGIWEVWGEGGSCSNFL